MNIMKLFNHKLVLGITNFIFSTCGIILLITGFYLFIDEQRILLSRLLGAGNEMLMNLPQPFFYYIALALTAAGIVGVFASVIGWWALCINNYCILSLYFLIVLFLLLMEFAACLMITLWPHCLGLNLDETIMVKALQGNYGVPGKEQITAAIDLAQTKFKCCAINSNINYDTSLWRLQSYGQPDWTVPLTCCHLSNPENEFYSYLDPKPINLTICQSLQRHEYEKSRHIDGCLDQIDEWYRQHYTIFLSSTLIMTLIEFSVLLSIILNCTRLQQYSRKIELTQSFKSNSRKSINAAVINDDRGNDENDHIYLSADIVPKNTTTMNNRMSTRVEGSRSRQQLTLQKTNSHLPPIPGDIQINYVQPPPPPGDLCKTNYMTTFTKVDSLSKKIDTRLLHTRSGQASLSISSAATNSSSTGSSPSPSSPSKSPSSKYRYQVSKSYLV